jgi:hypothetical protein
MFQRRLLLLPATLAALALSATPALAGEDPDPTPVPPAPVAPAPAAPIGTATLHVSHGCVSGRRARAYVTGTNIASVTYSVSGKRMKRVTRATSNGRYAFSMACSRLSVGAHTARAAVAFTAGTSPSNKSMRFQITRVGRTSARFTG